MTTAAAVRFTVPLVPPSANNYVRHTRAGTHYRTAEARAWDEAVAIYCRGQRVRADSYMVTATVYLAKGQRGDCDNFWKCLLDSIVRAKVIDSDAKITELLMRKSRDAANPRTELEVRANG
jgi:crossover junction endodeoxyribonuclease RusA